VEDLTRKMGTFNMNGIGSNSTGTGGTQSRYTDAYDRFFVELRNTSETLLATLATYSNVNKATAGVYSQKSFSHTGL